MGLRQDPDQTLISSQYQTIGATSHIDAAHLKCVTHHVFVIYIMGIGFPTAAANFLKNQENESFNFLVAVCVTTYQSVFLYIPLHPLNKVTEPTDVPQELFLVFMMLLTGQKEDLFWLLR